jgi:hypothetical protein
MSKLLRWSAASLLSCFACCAIAGDSIRSTVPGTGNQKKSQTSLLGSEQLLVGTVFSYRYVIRKYSDHLTLMEREFLQDQIDLIILRLSRTKSGSALEALVDLQSIDLGSSSSEVLTCEIQIHGPTIKPILTRKQKSRSTACLDHLNRFVPAEPKPISTIGDSDIPDVCVDRETLNQWRLEQIQIINLNKRPACPT